MGNNIDRRQFLTFVAGGAAAGLMPFSGCINESTDPIANRAERPNIVFILADDLGYGDLGCYGQKEIKTSNLDRMAADGMRFTQHYAGSTVCAPSRCVLMTGLHTGHAAVRGNREIKPEGQYPIAAETITVAKVLKRAGYITAVVGKWGLGGPGSSGVPNKQGFDHWFGYLCQRKAHSYYPEYLWKNGKKVILEKNKAGKKGTYSHDLFTTEAMDFIRQNKNRRFFLYLPYTIPHTRYEIPSTEPYSDRPWTKQEKVYAAMITRMDRDIGRIMNLLKKLNIDEKTIVFFSSDNGAAQRREGRFDSSGLLRGRKRDMYEGGIRVPMLARWPGKIKPASVTGHISAFWDFLPTCAELAGISAPKNIDGISMVPTLLGQDDRQKSHKFLYWEFFHCREKQRRRRAC
jgi:arylsulfatase A